MATDQSFQCVTARLLVITTITLRLPARCCDGYRRRPACSLPALTQASAGRRATTAVLTPLQRQRSFLAGDDVLSGPNAGDWRGLSVRFRVLSLRHRALSVPGSSGSSPTATLRPDVCRITRPGALADPPAAGHGCLRHWYAQGSPACRCSCAGAADIALRLQTGALAWTLLTTGLHLHRVWGKSLPAAASTAEVQPALQRAGQEIGILFRLNGLASLANPLCRRAF